jgi:regulatory protein
MDPELHKVLLKKAVALLARRAYSRGELRNKLAKMAGRLQVESTLDRLEQLNLLNDADYAYNFALRRMRQEGWSRAKVREALLHRQIAPATVELALEHVRNELGDESVLMQYVQKHCGKRGLPTRSQDIRRLVLHLRSRGFDEDQIFNALKQTIPAAVLQRFVTGE